MKFFGTFVIGKLKSYLPLNMANQKSEEISLLVDDEVFQVKIDILCEHSDYFRAMFSGNFSEQGKREICIDVVDANSMGIIIRYMTIGLIDIAEIPLQTVGELAIAANFLQVTELIKQIEYCLELQLSMSNWLEIMSIAENASYKKLEERSAAFGLYDFKNMKPEFIKPVHKLVWYLSHTHLNAESELHVFKFGFNWVLDNVNSADVLLIILGCLDLSRIKAEELNEIKILIKDYRNSLVEKVIDFLLKLATDYGISIPKLKENKQILCEMYTERVYTEVLNLLTDSKKRELKFKPCVAVWSREEKPDNLNVYMPHYLYMLHDMKDFKPWLEVVDKNLWGWKFVTWGVTKIVIVCGEHGKGTGLFWRGVKVYDTLTKEWTEHGVKLPSQRHGAVAVLRDSLFILGGVGAYRVVLDSAIVYDLKQRTYRKIANFPDAIQSPAACLHDQNIYASGYTNIYRYEEHGENDNWVMVLETNIRPSCVVSYKGYIYCIQSYFNDLYRFKPNVDTKLQLVANFKLPLSTICNYGDKLLAFETTDATQLANVAIQEYDEDGISKVLWHQDDSPFIINDVAGSCSIVDSMPPLITELSQYLKSRLAKYEACYSQ